MKEITSTEFQQNVGRYQDAAQLAPVAITKNGRTHSVLISAAFFEMVMKGRVARPVEDFFRFPLAFDRAPGQHEVMPLTTPDAAQKQSGCYRKSSDGRDRIDSRDAPKRGG